MICYKCAGKLKVVNTYTGESGKTQRLRCLECGTVHVAVTTLEIAERGRGAVSRRPRSGMRGQSPSSSLREDGSIATDGSG